MRSGYVIAALALAGLPARAQHCTGRELDGTYGMQLSGTTTISGRRAPVVGLARIAFTADRTLSGYSSVNFNGLLLGNPVTGNYEIAPDCALSLNLQDDSGGYQHFRGKAADNGQSAEFHQADPGTGEQGVILRTPGSCNQADLRGSYGFMLSGMKSKGRLGRDLKGQFSIAWESGAPSMPATVNVESDCTVEIEFGRASGGGPIKLRGILVNGGAEILAIETNPNVTEAVRFTAQ